jgi:hypothetical protein
MRFPAQAMLRTIASQMQQHYYHHSTATATCCVGGAQKINSSQFLRMKSHAKKLVGVAITQALRN